MVQISFFGELMEDQIVNSCSISLIEHRSFTYRNIYK